MNILKKLKSLVEKPDSKEVLEDTSIELEDAEISERRRVRCQNAKPGTKILLIDDSRTICLLLSKMLKQNKYRVQEALTAEIGLEIAFKHQPDLIFLDIVLPGMSGFEALRRLRKDPRTQDIPIIMISGNEIATEKYYAERIGADDFMKKPFSRYEVFHRIEALLDNELIPRRVEHKF